MIMLYIISNNASIVHTELKDFQELNVIFTVNKQTTNLAQNILITIR